MGLKLPGSMVTPWVLVSLAAVWDEVQHIYVPDQWTTPCSLTLYSLCRDRQSRSRQVDSPHAVQGRISASQLFHSVDGISYARLSRAPRLGLLRL
jgi:hypothetical protein